MIGVFLVHVGFIHVVRDLAKEKLKLFYFPAPSKLLHVSLYSKEMWAGDKLLSTSEIMQQPSPSDIPVLYLSLF